MSDVPTLPENPKDDHPAWAQATLRDQVALLGRLAEAGLRIALSIEARAAEAPVAEAPQVAMAFSRVARAVRMTALLQSRLIKDMEDARSRAAFAWSRDEETVAEEAARQDPAYGHKARVEAIVVRVAKAQGEDENEIDRIVQEAGERLDDDDIYGDVLTRPVGELVALICRHLGLEPDWGKLAEEAWAREEILSGIAASPFTRPPPLAGSDRSSTIDSDGDHEVAERACHRRPSQYLHAPTTSP